MGKWQKLPQEKIRERIFKALKKNVNYYEQNILGVPASHLDNRVFYQDAPFLSNAPYLSTLIHNPNHIGCHTLDRSESFFSGTQALEKEVVEICAEDILKGEKNAHDGYIAAGGTEANMQAIWIFRNYFMQECGADIDEIAILCSEDSHYSMQKAANVFNIKLLEAKVDSETREMSEEALANQVAVQKSAGIRYFICIANMMTTMFGSVDDAQIFGKVLKRHQLQYKIHVDGAYGGFFYPFSSQQNNLNFKNPEITSITLDAHKMLQAPYGTGIFLIRKGWIGYANTKEASYVEGEDYTLSGSRSGANAIAIWMILMTYGPNGWFEKILVLDNRANWLSSRFEELGVKFFRHKDSNIVTLKAAGVSSEIATKYGLVPDNHNSPQWYKIVIMDHVTIENLTQFLDDLQNEINYSKES